MANPYNQPNAIAAAGSKTYNKADFKTGRINPYDQWGADTRQQAIDEQKERQKKEREQQVKSNDENKQRAATALAELTKQSQKPVQGDQSFFTRISNLARPVSEGGVNVFADVGKAISDSARTAVKQTQMGTEITAKGGGTIQDQGSADKLKKFVDEDLKAGKLTSQQADSKKRKIQADIDKTRKTITEAEKKTGTKFDPSEGVTAVIDTASNLAGLGAIAKPVFTKAVEAASKRLGRDLSMDELKNLAQQTKKTIGDKYNAARPGAIEGFSKDIPSTASISSEVTPEQFKGTFVNPQKVDITTEPSLATDIGVKTPVKPQLKATTSESSVEVRKPKIITEQEYNSVFDKLNRSYEKELSSLEGMPPLRQQAAAQALEAKYSKALAQLDDDFNNPKLPAGTSKVKQIGRTKTEVTPASGGTPSGFVNTTGEMSDLEKTLFTSAKNKAENRLGRPLKTEETNKIYERTKKVAEEKGLTVPSQATPTADVGRVRPDGPVVDKVTTLEEVPTTPKPETPRPKYEERIDGELRTSGNAARIEQVALEKKLTDKMGDLPQYRSINMKEQAKEATDLISTNKQQAIDIIDGKANPPGNLKAQSVHQALEDIAVKEGDADLLTKLAKSRVNTELSESAQNLRIAAERDPHSAVEQIRQIRDVRAKLAEKRARTTVTKETANIRKKVEAATPKATKQDWNSFVKELTCR